MQRSAKAGSPLQERSAPEWHWWQYSLTRAYHFMAAKRGPTNGPGVCSCDLRQTQIARSEVEPGFWAAAANSWASFAACASMARSISLL